MYEYIRNRYIMADKKTKNDGKVPNAQSLNEQPQREQTPIEQPQNAETSTGPPNEQPPIESPQNIQTPIEQPPNAEILIGPNNEPHKEQTPIGQPQNAETSNGQPPNAEILIGSHNEPRNEQTPIGQPHNQQPPETPQNIQTPIEQPQNAETPIGPTNEPQNEQPNEQPPNQQLPRDNSTERVYDEEACPICLGPHVNKSRPDCGHVFCYQCLVDWCQIKLECPVCKQAFSSFKHSFQSPDNFQVHTPPPVAEDLEEIIIILNPPPNMGILDAREEFRQAFFAAILQSMLEHANAGNANPRSSRQ